MIQDTKTEIVRKLFNDKKYLKALRIAKTFKIGLSKQEQAIIARAFEMNSGNEHFYKLLGVNKEDQLQQAIEILKNKVI